MFTLTANRGTANYSSLSVWASYASCSVAYSIPFSPIYPYSVYMAFLLSPSEWCCAQAVFLCSTLAGFRLAFCLSPEVLIFLSSFSDILRGRGGDKQGLFVYSVFNFFIGLLPCFPSRPLGIFALSEKVRKCKVAPKGSIKNFLRALCKKIFIALHFLKVR